MIRLDTIRPRAPSCAAQSRTTKPSAEDRRASILYDEVDLAEEDGPLAHRLLFVPRDELTIDCRDVRVSITARPDPRVVLGTAFIEEHDEDSVGGADGEESRR